MKVVIFGAAGQVGSRCMSELMQAGYQVIPLLRSDVDFTNVDGVAQAVEHHHPDIVLNACAYTAVDKAESEPEIADCINHLAVAALAKACEHINALLIHISTDYVFDGCASRPYEETSVVNPLGVYGKTKWLGEQAVVVSGCRYIILRTSWVFGEMGNNFVKTMLKLGKEKSTLAVVDDQIGRPTYVGHIADTILSIINDYQSDHNMGSDIYHFSSAGEVSWHEFAQAIFTEAYALGCLSQLVQVTPIPSSSYPTPAPRPMYSVLDTAKIEKHLGRVLPSWQQGLSSFLHNAYGH